jgi:hypothetical protein
MLTMVDITLEVNGAKFMADLDIMSAQVSSGQSTPTETPE